MTEKRYTYHKSEITGLFVISDEKHRETFSGMKEEYNCMRIVHKLNTLTDENEQLKSELKALRKKYNDFSDAVDKRLQEMDKRLFE